MLIRTAQPQDIETLFDIRTSVVENYQSREEIAELGITPDSVAEMLQTDCQAWVAEFDEQIIGFSIANKAQQTILGIFVCPEYEVEGCAVSRRMVESRESITSRPSLLDLYVHLSVH
ncbi:MAG: hypothetical protein AAFQ80_24735, partial [Cyanobacteria bacterium J06621_8]